MHLDLRQLAVALGGEISGDQVLAPGPGHSPGDRSLAVRLDTSAPDGFLVHSFAHDDPIACKTHVREKCGLPAFKANGGSRHHRTSIDVAALLREAVLSQQQEAPKGRLTATYQYTDANGSLLYQVLRYEPKTFRQRRPDGKGGWIWKLEDRRVVYRLPELLKYPDATVFLAEGEKDTDRIASLGQCATTVASSKWTAECVQALTGRDIWILEDNDTAGRKRAQEAAEALDATAKSIRIVQLPGLPDGGDVSDWLDHGHTGEELVEVCLGAPLWTVETQSTDQASNNSKEKKPVKPPSVVNAKRLNQMTFGPIKYVVPDYIVEGLTLFAGKPKVGKSWLLLHVAFAVAEGGFTLGNVQCEQGDVLYCALEDNPRRLQSRLTKLFGTDNWPAKLDFICEMPRLAEGGLDFIKSWIEGAARPRLAIVDTLAMVRMPKRGDQSPYEADYAAVKELREMALKYGIAIVLVHHLRKAEADDVFDTISGTLGLSGAPDTVMIIQRNNSGTTLHAKGRDLIEIEKAIKFDPGTCTWTVLGEAAVIRKSTERTGIVEALQEAGNDPLTPNQIAAHCGMKPVNVRKMLAKLLAEGAIKKASYGKYILSIPATKSDRGGQE
jgi:hypothetical protein